MNFLNKKSYLFLGSFILLGFFFGGFLLGGKIISDKQLTLAQENADKVNMDAFWKVWKTLDEKYPNSAKITNEEKLFGAIAGLVDSYKDPYTVFFSPEEAKIFEEEISGSFTGIGIEVGIKENTLTVIAPLKNTPGYRAGIKSGDKILKIDETSTLGMTVENAVKIIRGPKGSIVNLTIQREGEKENKIIPITRDVINMPTLDTEKISNDIFLIKLHSFSANSTTLFRDAIVEFGKTKNDKLILDLRGNPGGYLEASVQMASWFLPSGKTVLIEDTLGSQKNIRSKGFDVFSKNLKMVILLDGGSASASEILAGALRDHKKAIIVGEQSFGKGSVQEVIEITPDTLLKVTTAKWLTPNGDQISEKGITPDYVVESDNTEKEKGIDKQKEKAIEILRNWSNYKK